MSSQRIVKTWVDVLRRRAAEAPDQTPFTFLTDGEEQVTGLTYAQLDRQARAIAVALLAANATGGRALLLCPPGLDFIAGLFGCWYAAVAAVPAYPPRSAQHSVALATLETIARDAQPSAVLTVSRLSATISATKVAACPIIATDTIRAEDAEQWSEPGASADTLACLQYTSGSTTTPRGVMLTHAHLLANSAIIQQCFGHSPRSHGVIWLPPYHDMGLIGGILQTPFVGCRVTLMAPAAFLQRPVRWLRAISRFGGTTSGGPDFAYNLCVDRVTEEERKTLDLSTWDLAFSGAEPINPRTFDRFVQAFGPSGFRREAFYPCYGLAEATLIVSGGAKSAGPVLKRLSDNKVVVGCGQPQPAGAVTIVDPETRMRRNASEEGEVWVRRNGTPQAYWQKPDETEATFNAHLSDSGGEGPFLRTGDLGFIDGDELYITGRLKDLIIVRGVNHHPQDIEHTVQASHAALRPGCGAAFSVNGDGHERLVIAQEVHRTERDAPTEPLIQAIRTAVNERHDVDVWSVVLLKPGQILKTSSGKVRRAACRQALLDGALEAIARWEQPTPQPAKQLQPLPTGQRPASVQELEEALTQMLARAVNLPPDEIDPADSFARYGVDSAGAASLAADLSDLLGREVTVTMFYDYPSVRDLALHLAGGQREKVT